MRRRPGAGAVLAGLLLAGLLLAGLLLGGSLLGGPAPAAAAPAQNCAEPDEGGTGPPWPLATLAAADVWPFTRGGGATVAVLSTGVDGTQPQLRGRVLPGFDAVDGNGAADSDCTGTGTQVAGVIAAQPSAGVTGLAPRAMIQPVRVVADVPQREVTATAAPLARGIRYAATNGADVIVVATPVYRNDPQVREAVADALARGVVLVAAAGDAGAPDETNPTPYPAAYDGVLGVGAADPEGRAWADSQRGSYVDLVAPGVAVPTVQRGTGLVQGEGTAIAAGYTGAAAALVRAKRGDLLATQITRMLVATASPTARGEAYGAGMVNPYAAVTDQIVPPSGRALPAVVAAPPPDTAAERQRRNLALLGTLLAACTVIGVLLVAAAVRRSRRQHWRPGLSPRPPVVDEPVEPGPPVMLLDEPTHSRGP
jgi:hypothetical protein